MRRRFHASPGDAYSVLRTDLRTGGTPAEADSSPGWRPEALRRLRCSDRDADAVLLAGTGSPSAALQASKAWLRHPNAWTGSSKSRSADADFTRSARPLGSGNRQSARLAPSGR
ncbi:hypothetical protein GCM10007887_34690 [Methylobacterium haplocladii]|uniref:Uncharacterized protein n=1 Tax=Methylobacterium haplocladii TaxID=1176176 RepID=A0A512ISP7_9HYPH|nr:hypothetical protein MHA02_30830 [Methylobacterium haplocladii]GLS60781.1 hypothetical protein GCM10007887_34690 [Methylobacterium haplocladii]